jgi:hypothetical protein
MIPLIIFYQQVQFYTNSKVIYPLSKQLAITAKKINIAVHPDSVDILKLNYRK